MRQLHLIGYDVSDNRTRSRVLRAVRGNSIGGQKSLYECWLDAREREAMHQSLADLIEATDRIILARLDTRAAIHTLGVATRPHDATMFYLG